MVFDEMHLQTIQHNLQQKPAKNSFLHRDPWQRWLTLRLENWKIFNVQSHAKSIFKVVATTTTGVDLVKIHVSLAID